MARGTGTGRPRVAVGYGPRCIPVMAVAEAAAPICDLIWLIDGRLPEMREMVDLLARFGAVVDAGGLAPDQLAEAVAPHRPSGLITLLDADMVVYAGLAERLGLPFHSPATALGLTDKPTQRRLLGRAGLDVPAFTVVPRSAPADRKDAFGAVTWPAVLKPRSAQGSRYTFLAADAADARRLLSSLGPDRPEMLLEAYLADDPERSGGPYAGYVSVETVVSAGAISHIALTGRFPLAEHFRETGFFIPAALAGGDREAVLALATAAIEALDVTTGCLHTEVKFTPGGPRVIEVNGRVGGGVPEMLQRASGTPLLELILRIALGEVILVDGPVATERIGYRFFLQPPAVTATVAAIEGIDAVSEYPGVDALSLHQGPGAVLDWRDGSRLYILSVLGAAADDEELLRAYRLVQQQVAVTYGP